MHKKASFVLGAMMTSAILWLGGNAFGAGDTVKLVYPTSAKEEAALAAPVDKKVAPPVSEDDADVDVETPLGQVQSVLDALRRLEDRQENLTRTVDRLRDSQAACPVDRTDEVIERVDAIRFPDLSGLATTTDVSGVLEQVAGVRASLEEAVERAASLEEEARAWRESIDRATAAVEKLASIKDSKATTWLCWCVIGLFALSLFARAFRAVGGKVAELKRYAEAYRQYQAQQTQPQLNIPKE